MTPLGSPRTDVASRAPRRFGVAVALPPAAWAAQEMTCAVASWVACDAGHAGLARGLVAGITLVALALTLGSLRTAQTTWRKLHGSESVVFSEGRETLDMAGVVGVASGILFTLAIVWTGLCTLLVGNLCGARR